MQTFTNIKTGKQVTAYIEKIGGNGDNANDLRVIYYSLRNGEPWGPVRIANPDRFNAIYKEG